MDQDADLSFAGSAEGLSLAISLLLDPPTLAPVADLPALLPEEGCGEIAALHSLAPLVLGGAARLGGPASMAHMDPPTPWITWAMAMWNASLNQNLLHPDTAPFARDAEARVVAWLAPFFGMGGGHMTSGSTLAILTALWAAREICGVSKIVAADSAHLSIANDCKRLQTIAKAARILGMRVISVPTDARGRLIDTALKHDMRDCALVLTAGTTACGVVDPLRLAGQAAWTHVDAAWAGPLRLSARHAHVLAGMEKADSVAISAHKFLFQPQGSALVLFRAADRAHDAVASFGHYLAAPNVGVMGSRGAAGIPLLATLMAWGRAGIARRVDTCMSVADRLAAHIATDTRIVLLARPDTGVFLWRPRGFAADSLHARLPRGTASLATLAGEKWLRNVCANPNADPDAIYSAIAQEIDSLTNSGRLLKPTAF